MSQWLPITLMLDDSAQSRLWGTSALNFNVRLFRLPNVLAFLATPGVALSPPANTVWRFLLSGPLYLTQGTGEKETAEVLQTKTNGCESGAKSRATDLVKRCRFPLYRVYSRKLGFTDKKLPNWLGSCSASTEAGFGQDLEVGWNQPPCYRSLWCFSSFFWHGSARSAHFFPRSSSILRRSVQDFAVSLCGNWSSTNSLRNSARKGETCAL